MTRERRAQRPFLRALGLIKSAAATVNLQLGALPPGIGTAILYAADRVAQGLHNEEFAEDFLQSRGVISLQGVTSINMETNRVIARLASQSLGDLGVTVHPNDHVNRSQSSNDVVPSAMHIAAAELVEHSLFPALRRLHKTLLAKAAEFDGVLKLGRAHLQDAVPMRLGQEFGAYARQVELSMARITHAMEGIYELPLGGAAIGSGLNAPPEFARAAIRILAQRTGLPLREAEDHFEAQSARDAAAFLSGALKGLAISLTKIAGDIRWLSSGPRCGLGELRLPELQPGSSIMPGRANPEIPESVLMACAQVMGYDAAISWCCASGNLELNTMTPLIAYDLLEAIDLLASASNNFADKCVAGIEADRERLAADVERSLALSASLTPEIGFEAAAEIAKVAYRTGRSIREVACEDTEIPRARLAELLDVRRMAGPAHCVEARDH